MRAPARTGLLAAAPLAFLALSFALHALHPRVASAQTPSEPVYPPIPPEERPAAPAPARPRAPPKLPRFHAPTRSLWLGGRVGYLGFGYSFYDETSSQAGTFATPLTTGRLVGGGASAELDVGARVARRYTPYFGLELGVLSPGARFEGVEGVTARSYWGGIGFRYSGGNLDRLSFLADLAFGVRWIVLSSPASTFTMRSTELFRLGLGAEWRTAPELTFSPLFTLSGGTVDSVFGQIPFAPGTTPTYGNTPSVITGHPSGYLVISFSLGGHFDLFAR